MIRMFMRAVQLPIAAALAAVALLAFTPSAAQADTTRESQHVGGSAIGNKGGTFNWNIYYSSYFSSDGQHHVSIDKVNTNINFSNIARCAVKVYRPDGALEWSNDYVQSTWTDFCNFIYSQHFYVSSSAHPYRVEIYVIAGNGDFSDKVYVVY